MMMETTPTSNFKFELGTEPSPSPDGGPGHGLVTTMSKKQSYRLNKAESSTFALMLPSISTITFYTGEPPISYLQNRIGDIVMKNPWLQGRLVTRKDGLHIDCFTEPNLSSFAVSEDSQLCEDLEYSVMCSRLSRLAVKKGNQCIDKDESLFRIVVIVTSQNRFAVFMSFSHILGDGYTFYEIYGMLGEKLTTRSLIFERVDSPESENMLTKVFDGVQWIQSIGAFINIIFTLLFRRVTATVHSIEPSWIEQQKTAHKAAGQMLISTNDILTSWFFRLVGCDVCLMAENLRGRFPPYTSDHAGNLTQLTCLPDYVTLLRSGPRACIA